MGEVTRTELFPYVFLTHLQTDKFKTNTLSITLLTQLDRETAAKNAVLPRVLLRGTDKYPDMEQIAQRLDELYGAQIEQLVRKKGEIQCVELYANFVDDSMLPAGEGIFEKVTDLLGEILLKPAKKMGKLCEDYVNSERAKLIDEIQGRINNKIVYAIGRLDELMCDGEAFATYRLGTEAEAETIEAASLTSHYQTLLETAPIEIIYTGRASVDEVTEAVTKALKDLPRGEPDLDLGTDVRMNSVAETARAFTEEMDVTQGQLSMGFRLGECMEEPNYPALELFHNLYGGSVTSKLFLNVRERLSLCYFASSILEKHKGLLLVISGIEFAKYEEAKAEILAQLQAIATGDITDEELLWAKRAMMTDLAMLKDDQNTLQDFYLSQTILGEDDSIEEIIAKVEQIEKQDLIEIANSLQLDAVYFLKGAEGAGA